MNLNSILPPNHQWIGTPSVLIGDFCGFLPDDSINVFYPITGPRGGWGRINRNDFIPGELERLEPGCKIERFAGSAKGPKGEKFTIRARVNYSHNRHYPIHQEPMPSKKSRVQTIYHVIWLRTGQCVIGFTYPPKLHTDETKYLPPEKNEIPIAEACYAILGNERPYKFDNRESAEQVASAIPGGKVELWED
jgi:hypothetical protein